MLPIFVFGTVLMMWSRVTLAPSAKSSEQKEEPKPKVTIEVVTSQGD
ncbi:hypothetical protein N836_14620 [Leptolyngbya sp. Heron Island J]|nr:hypothetical protein [Leptolyngbya sp. Heron Island J]ESA34991.1 hypothetical protein N836_14620 [Leptolyngbya sp. Heron Island J]